MAKAKKAALGIETNETHVMWAQAGLIETTAREQGHCPACLARAVVALPSWLLAVQPDETTHVCAPFLGGCNLGYAR